MGEEFYIGNIIVGKKEYSREYSITSHSQGFVGEILDDYKGRDTNRIRVRVLECKKIGYIGEEYDVNKECFELKKDNKNTIILL